MSAVFAVEPFSAFYPQARDLLLLHYDEVAPHKELLKLDPNLDVYHAMERAGSLHVITARIDGVLIGYIIMMVHPHLHYKQVIVAVDDVHFIHPAHRRGSLGSRLIKSAEAEMVKVGARIMALRTKDSNNHGLLFERLGFEPQDVVYTKRIGS